ncbi:MAG: hypothetical protein CML13_16055 [Puniceicoccaceae bacterium]|nr:hypothetical protein [Puniceicoccaceae bacterium]|tara:strand:+ start:220 stop:588 length:369 start_codon:yes stop_codon:yes gene_type:complete
MTIEEKITIQTARLALMNLQCGRGLDWAKLPAPCRKRVEEVKAKIPDGDWGTAENRAFFFVYLEEADISEEEEAYDEEQFIESRGLFALYELLCDEESRQPRIKRHPDISERDAFTNPYAKK